MAQIKLSMKQKQNQRCIDNRLVVVKGVRGGRGLDWKFGISRCKLIYI